MANIKMSFTLSQRLARLGACQEARTWASGFDSGIVAWENCDRPDWMFWLLDKTNVKREILVAIACDIASTVSHYDKSGAASKCIATVRDYLTGTASLEQVREARTLAWKQAAAVYAADAVYAAANAAANAAADAVYAAANAAAYAAAYAAVYAAAYAAANAAAYAAAANAAAAADDANAAAADAAYAAVYAAANAAADAANAAADARLASKQQSCDVIRKYVPYSMLEDLLC